MKCNVDIRPLKELADIQTGPFGSQLHKEDYVEVGTPIVTVEHLGNRIFTEQNLPKVSDGDRKRLEKYLLSTGDIVFSRVGSVDRCSYVDERHSGWMFSGRCLRIRPSECINPLYLYYYFCLEEVRQFVRNIAVGATMPSINTKLLGEVPVSVPSIQTQRRIAAILSSLDDKIELNNKINANLERQAQALFKAWFVDFEPFGGKMPEDWRRGRLSEIASISAGKRPPMRQELPTSEVNIPLIGAASIMGYTNTVLYNEPILVTGRVGTHGVVQRFRTSCWASDNTLVIKSKFYEYVYLALQRVDYSNMNRGTTQPLITQKDLMNVQIVIPPEAVMSQFEENAGVLMALCSANCNVNAKLGQIRDGLLPKLMSGKVFV